MTYPNQDIALPTGKAGKGAGVIRVFIGADSNEVVAAHVLAHSIIRHSSVPVCVTPLILGQLPMTRKKAEYQSTEFSFSRFLVPYLCDFEGRAIFMDCDMLCRTDIKELWKLTNTGYAVSVVKHNYTPKSDIKFLGNRQARYEKKNWSSLMVFENSQCRELTPLTVNEATGLYLHQFKWLDSEIGEIPVEWNHLVGEYEKNPKAKLVHFTLGTPCFKAYDGCEFSDEWHAEKDLMLDYNRIGEYDKLKIVRHDHG